MATTRDLVRAVQAAGPQAAAAEEELLKINEGLIRTAVQRLTRSAMPDEDLLQEGRLAFSYAVRHYDVSHCASLATYAWAVISHAVCKALRRRSVAAEAIGTFVEGDEHECTAACYETSTFEEQYALRDALSKLEPSERQLLTSLYWNGESQTSIANRFHVSHTAIQKRKRRALQKLRVALSA